MRSNSPTSLSVKAQKLLMDLAEWSADINTICQYILADPEIPRDRKDLYIEIYNYLNPIKK